METAVYQQLRNLIEAQGAHKIYQAWPRLGIDGQRPIEERFKIYGLDRLIGPETSVLDLGCNVGFMSLKCAETALEVWGIDRLEHWIEIARLAGQCVGAPNAFFHHGEALAVLSDVRPSRHDLVLSLSFHHWNTDRFKEYARVCFQKQLRIGGHLLFESHKLGAREPFDDYSLWMQRHLGFELVDEGRTQCPTNYPRPNPPRKWHMLKLTNK
jgi:SAM-dependent methyltransferase